MFVIGKNCQKRVEKWATSRWKLVHNSPSAHRICDWLCTKWGCSFIQRVMKNWKHDIAWCAKNSKKSCALFNNISSARSAIVIRFGTRQVLSLCTKLIPTCKYSLKNLVLSSTHRFVFHKYCVNFSAWQHVRFLSHTQFLLFTPKFMQIYTHTKLQNHQLNRNE